MAKQAQKQSARETSKSVASVKIGVISFYSGHQTKPNGHSQHAEVHEITGDTLTEKIRKSISEGHEFSLISFTPSPTLHFLDAALKPMLAADKHADIVLFTSNEKNKLSGELIGGFRNSELSAPAVLIHNSLFSTFKPEDLDESGKAEFLYTLEKSDGTWDNVATDHHDKQGYKPLGLKGRLMLSRKWYTRPGKTSGVWNIVFILTALLSMVVMGMMSKTAAISGDEFTQYHWADTAIIPYYTDGKSAALSDPAKLMHLYGSSFDTFTALMARVTGTSDVMEMRHFWNSMFGFICIFFTALIVKRLTKSYFWGTMALVLLFFTPRILGDALNNPKDIPFAAGYVISLYYAIRYYAGGNRKPRSFFIGIIAGVSLAISIRIGGLVLLPIVAFVAGIEYIRQVGWQNFIRLRWTGFRPLIVGFLSITVISYILGILFWPYGISDPFVNPFKALKEFTNFGATLRQLFEGKLFDSDLLPRYYLFKYILITIPIASLAGMALFLGLGIMRRKTVPASIWYLVFAALFPVVYIWIQKSNVYGGLRQILFTIPCLVAVAVYGFYLLERELSKLKFARAAAASAALLLTAPAAVHVVQSHPLEYVYFNETVGGVAGAYGNYEMDYYLASLRPCTEWFLKNVARKNPDKKYTVLTYGMDQVKYYCRNDKNVHVGFTRFDDRSEKNWDYAIFFNAYLDKARLLGGKYPPVGTVFTPMVAGKPMGLVIQRPSHADFEAYQADRKGDYQLSIAKYKEYLKADPNSNEVYMYMSASYYNMAAIKLSEIMNKVELTPANKKMLSGISDAIKNNNVVNELDIQAKNNPEAKDIIAQMKAGFNLYCDSAIWASKKSVELYPEFTKGLMSLYNYYTAKADFENAVKTMTQYLDARPKDVEGWLYKAQALARKGDLNGALAAIKSGISFNPMVGQLYQTGAAIYQLQKDNVNLNQWAQAIDYFVDGKDQATKVRALEAIAGIYLDITGKKLPQLEEAEGE